MLEQEELKKGYVVVDTTIGEIIKKVNKEKAPNQHGYYDIVPIYEHEIDRSNLTAEEKIIQENNRWYKERTSEIRLYEDAISALVSKSMYDELSAGTKEFLPDKIHERIMNTKFRSVLEFMERSDGTVYLEIFDEIGEDGKRDYIESRDMNELNKELEKVNMNSSYTPGKPMYVWLERVVVGAYPYAIERIEENINKAIKRLIRTELVYCLKNNMIIVPEEYLSKGREGIKEWQELKRSNSKSNSMEKRMLKQIFADKREFAYKAMAKVIDQVGYSHNWSVPSLTVDGRWNKTKMDKLITQIADTKDKQKFINMPNEELIKLFKEYWKGVLTKACEEIDMVKVEEEK